jgi:putative SOS response-associated peptidase YedK
MVERRAITPRFNANLPVHHRMPVVLTRNDYEPWLDPAATELEKLLTPCPADELICYPVDMYVNKTGNEGPKCIEPVQL